VVVAQYQKPDQITPSKTSMVVGTAISHRRDLGEPFCVLTPSLLDHDLAPPPFGW
jgi:hypothetical protein